MLLKCEKLSLDTETTGLRPFHGARLFSIIIGVSSDLAYYFNFAPSEANWAAELNTLHLEKMKVLFSDPNKMWFIHKANFDCHILWRETIELKGTIHCTLSQARVEHNDHMSYDLDSCLERIGLKKDDKVKEWILDNNAWEWQDIPGKKVRKKNLHYDKVPFDLIVPYGEQDAKGTFALGEHQTKSIWDQSEVFPLDSLTPLNIMKMERDLTKVILKMEQTGVKIDRSYCEKAIKYEENRAEKAVQLFKQETGREYQASPKLFADIFNSERRNWQFTEKGNPSFESDVLSSFRNPAAAQVLILRDAKAKADFYHGFLYQADREDIVHPQFNSGGTATGRFSSSEPNLQNLTAEDGVDEEFVVRRAIVPRPGYLFIMPDWKSMEYTMMLDYAVKIYQRTHPTFNFEVADKVKAGFDVHTATADLMGARAKKEISRREAKILNFMLLYGGGAAKLAKTLGITVDAAYQLKKDYFSALPYVETMMSQISDTIKKRGWVRNWAGRKYTFKDRNFSYKGPNYVIQGGCADAAKSAMCHIDRLFSGSCSRLVLTIHDELPCEIHEKDVGMMPKKVKEIMESMYPHHYLPLTVDMEWSNKSLADKVKGFPV